MKHTVRREWLDYVMQKPGEGEEPGALLIVDYVTYSTIVSWNRRYHKHGFRFYQCWPKLMSDPEERWLPNLGESQRELETHVEFVAGLHTKELRDAYEKQVNPWSNEHHCWVCLTFNKVLVLWPLPPVLSAPEAQTRQQLPKVAVGIHLTAAELALLDASRLVDESRGAAVLRHLQPVINPGGGGGGVGGVNPVNSPASPPPETT
jgi:hypothetical protein